MARRNLLILASFGVALLTTGAFYVGLVLATGAPTGCAPPTARSARTARR
ncbi:MAG: hypothetical protein ACOYOB_20730 [Myxococcota bacterium]